MARLDILGPGPAATRLRKHEQTVDGARERVRAAELAQRAGSDQADQLHAALVEAIASDDSKAQRDIRAARRALEDQEHGALVEGAHLALKRAEADLSRFLIESYDALIAEHTPRAVAAQERLGGALVEYVAALNEWHGTANVSGALYHAAGRGTGRDVPSLPPAFDALRQEIKRVNDHHIPSPIPREMATTATIYERGEAV